MQCLISVYSNSHVSLNDLVQFSSKGSQEHKQQTPFVINIPQYISWHVEHAVLSQNRNTHGKQLLYNTSSQCGVGTPWA